MILLVAMGVVIAAVLYILLSGLAHGPGSTPIATAFAAGHPTPGTCVSGSAQILGPVAISGGCSPGDFIYTLSVESSTVSFGSVLFDVRTTSGLAFTGGGATSSFALLDEASHVAAIGITGTTIAMAGTWSGYGLTTTAPTYSTSSSLTNLYTIVIDSGSSTPISGQGLIFVALGTGAYSGMAGQIYLP